MGVTLRGGSPPWSEGATRQRRTEPPASGGRTGVGRLAFVYHPLVVPWYVWIPFAVLAVLLVLTGLFALLARWKGGRYLHPIVRTLSKIGFMRRMFERMSTAALERSNPDLANALRKMRTFGDVKTPEQAQRALKLLTPAERKAYMEAVGEQAPQTVQATNRQQRRSMERGVQGIPVQGPQARPKRPKKR